MKRAVRLEGRAQEQAADQTIVELVEGGERALTDNSFKRIMFLAQDSVREIVQKGW